MALSLGPVVLAGSHSWPAWPTYVALDQVHGSASVWLHHLHAFYSGWPFLNCPEEQQQYFQQESQIAAGVNHLPFRTELRGKEASGKEAFQCCLLFSRSPDHYLVDGAL